MTIEAVSVKEKIELIELLASIDCILAAGAIDNKDDVSTRHTDSLSRSCTTPGPRGVHLPVT